MRQKWGQNFLTDESMSRRIVNALRIVPGERVMEIGPGRGALTRWTLEKYPYLTAVELDSHLAENLRNRWGREPRIEIIQDDFLKWPLPPWPPGSVKILGNLPYSAANAILRKILDWPSWREAVVMVQKEVAERILASPGSRDYGILTLAVRIKASPEKLFDVPPEAFRPRPRVMSTVLKLTRRSSSLVRREELFFRVLHAAFGQRRKTIVNSLSHGLGREKSGVEKILISSEIDPGARPETLSLEDYDRLTGNLFVEGQV